MLSEKNKKILSLLFSLAIILFVWTRNSFDSLNFDSDIGRDLSEISNIQAGEVVWLGPWLNPGLHASSAYYYLFYPALILASGKVSGMVVANLILAIFSIGLLGLLAVKKYGHKGNIVMLTIALLPMVTTNVLHPGNGFTYIFLIIGSLSVLWFELPLFFGSFLAGMAIGFHPGAGFLPIFLFYEWWRKGKKFIRASTSLLAFSIPIAPLIIFEVITKGYIIRNFFARHTTGGVNFELSTLNFQTISSLLGLPQLVLLILIGLSGYFSWRSKSKKLKIWFSLMIFCIFICLLFDGLIGRYLFGIALITIFTLLISFIQHKKAWLILIPLIIFLFFKSPVFFPADVATRTINRVERTADIFDQKQLIDKSKKIAVVSALSPSAEVPQADDYRYLLRNRGYNVTKTVDNKQADTLVMFIEVEKFDWQNWSNWEIQQFGAKKIDKVENIDGITVVTFSKE